MHRKWKDQLFIFSQITYYPPQWQTAFNLCKVNCLAINQKISITPLPEPLVWEGKKRDCNMQLFSTPRWRILENQWLYSCFHRLLSLTCQSLLFNGSLLFARQLVKGPGIAPRVLWRELLVLQLLLNALKLVPCGWHWKPTNTSSTADRQIGGHIHTENIMQILNDPARLQKFYAPTLVIQPLWQRQVGASREKMVCTLTITKDTHYKQLTQRSMGKDRHTYHSQTSDSQAPVWTEIHKSLITMIMYVYHGLINALSTHMIHINLNTIFYIHVEDSPTKTITQSIIWTHACTHTHTHACIHPYARAHAHTYLEAYNE